MALALETTIMMEIGLGDNYRWFNGSGSCEYIRQQAANKLEASIQKHYDAGERIIAPDSNLMALAQASTRWDDSQYELTKAWQVMSYILAAHIHAVNDPEQLTRIAEYIRENYQSACSQKERFSYHERHG